jgi:arylsulfatase A-like enzyme
MPRLATDLGRRLWLACAAGALALGCGESDGAKPQRLVLITLDTLRYDSYASPGGSGEFLMPATRKLAESGLSFENFYANTSTTQPSHASLFTGLQPWRHGVTRNGMVLDAGLPNLTASLQSHGFATHAVVSSFPVHHDFGFARGFDHYEDEFDESYVNTWEGRSVEGGRFFSLGESVTDRAVSALDAAPGGDQFFWFHYFDPHDPYGDTGDVAMGVGTLLRRALEPSSAPGMSIEEQLELARQLYELDVRAMDVALARLFARLEQDGDQFETHILITADHGESFGELGAIGHGKRVTREQVQVPLLIISPHAVAGLRSDGASLIDLAQTALGLVELDASEFEGRDLLAKQPTRVNPVLGMRRSFAKPKLETTSDGQRLALAEQWFFRVQEGVLVSGNQTQALLEGDRLKPLHGAADEDVRAQFRALEILASEGPTAIELDTEEVKSALQALGYLSRDDRL